MQFSLDAEFTKNKSMKERDTFSKNSSPRKSVRDNDHCQEQNQKFANLQKAILVLHKNKDKNDNDKSLEKALLLSLDGQIFLV